MARISSEPCDRADEVHGLLFAIDTPDRRGDEQFFIFRNALEAYQYANRFIADPNFALRFAQTTKWNPVDEVVDKSHCCFYWQNTDV